ncbi:MAG TPA: DUF5132 domain-containing protein [Gammaproteobacteria bacterium]|nr:DUF5132 domain-containing protein [Gammaproteobacteria bacterium]
MAPHDGLFNASMTKGLVIGLGTAFVAPVAVSALSGLGRPMARAALKSGLVFYDKGRETLAEMGEVVDDLVAEARAELEEDRLRRGSEPEEGAGEGGAEPPPEEGGQ